MHLLSVTTLNLSSMLLLPSGLCRCICYPLNSFCMLLLPSGPYKCVGICHDIKFIKHAALAIRALQMPSLSVTTLNWSSMLFLPSGLCRCVCYLSRHWIYLACCSCHWGSADAFVFANMTNFLSMLLLPLGLCRYICSLHWIYKACCSRQWGFADAFVICHHVESI